MGREPQFKKIQISSPVHHDVLAYDDTDSTWKNIAGLAPAIVVHKTADTSRNTTTDLVADPDLTTTLKANTDYACTAEIWVNSGATPDFKWVFSATDGSFNFTATHAAVASGGNMVADVGNKDIVSDFMVGLGVPSLLLVSLRILTGGSGGTFSFDWGQNTSNGGATIVHQISRMRFWEIT